MLKIISLIIFLAGYLVISQEHILKISKTAISLLLGAVLWLLVALNGQNNINHALVESASEIFGLVIFLLSAMTLVEILTHYGLFDVIYTKLTRMKLKDKSQFIILTFLAFVFSSFLDNLTTTIVFLQISSRFFRGKNLLRASAAIVIASNAGGAFSPIGDVTTTLLWLSGKFTPFMIISQGFLPSLSVFLVSTYFLSQHITTDTKDIVDRPIRIGRIEWFIISLCLASFLLPLMMTSLHLPPYMGLLFGLGIVWFVVDIIKHRLPERTSLMLSIEKFFQKTDIASLYFFIGILLSISALGHIGVLEDISKSLFSSSNTNGIILGNIAIGALSAVFDNIPLTAAAIDIIKTTDQQLWVLLAFTVGVGGSILSIGSAPGIIAMSMIKELTFASYLKIATIPAILAYTVGIIVWFIQYRFIF